MLAPLCFRCGSVVEVDDGGVAHLSLSLLVLHFRVGGFSSAKMIGLANKVSETRRIVKVSPILDKGQLRRPRSDTCLWWC